VAPRKPEERRYNLRECRVNLVNIQTDSEAESEPGISARSSAAGLPDFSWYKIPKQEKYSK
jgi:hypothetical protein